MHNHNHTHHGSSRRIGWAFFLNFFFTIIEFIGGWLTNSTAIMADAVHDLGDTLSIGSSWMLEKLGRKSANSRFTYGYRRLSLLGALINAIVLTVGSIWVVVSAVPRLLEPVMPHTEGMMGLAVLGIAVNGFAAYRLMDGKTLNEKVLNWHLMEDVLGWVAVLLVAIVMYFIDWPILDPLLSIAIAGFILFNVVRNLKATINLFIQGVPDQKLLTEIEGTLLNIKHVNRLHHLHLWSLDGEQHVLTAHVEVLTIENIQQYAGMKTNIHKALEPYNLAHTTIEIELCGVSNGVFDVEAIKQKG